jgi:hypothetical protein
MQVIHISCLIYHYIISHTILHSTIFFEIINLTQMISILNSIFTFHVLHDEMNKTRSNLHMFENFLNQFNLFYICNITRVMSHAS